MFPFSKNEKTALFIDGPNLYSTSKALGFDVDYYGLLSFFQSEFSLVRAYYYTRIFDDQEYSPIRPLVDWLDYNGFAVISKPAREYTDALGRRKLKGSMDVDITVDIIEISEHVDHVVLFSGEGDFKPLLRAVQRKGTKVTVISTIETSPPMIADDLRRQADHFVDLSDLRESFKRYDVESDLEQD